MVTGERYSDSFSSGVAVTSPLSPSPPSVEGLLVDVAAADVLVAKVADEVASTASLDGADATSLSVAYAGGALAEAVE